MRVNWDHITNEKDFQRLISHLVGLECPVLGFIPSSPYIGKDGGWDGRFEGVYPFENLEGIFSFQAKWTKYNRKEALTQLKGPIAGEIQKAIDNGVDHLRVATNAELDVNQVLELEALKPDSLKTLKIWERENLSMRLERRPLLLHLFFNLPQHPLFAPWQVYVPDYEPQLLTDAPENLTITKSVLEPVERFLRSSDSQILLLSAPAGNGKSHFLREIAKLSPSIEPGFEVYLAKIGVRSMKDAIQNEINQGTKYLLLIDDADRIPEDIGTLLALLPSNGGSIKLVLACRAASRSLVEDTIADSRYRRPISQLELPEWKKEDLVALLRHCSQKASVDSEEEIVSTYKNPYLITWIGHNLRGQAVPVDEMLATLINDLESDARKTLRDLIDDRYLVDRMLLHLSMIVPFVLNSDSKELGVIAHDLGLSAERVSSSVQALLNCGILRQAGYRCRFSPDLKGEFFLNQQLKSLDTAAVKKLVLTWIPVCATNVFVNLGSTYRLAELSSMKDVLTEIVKSWIEEASEASALQRSTLLEKVEKIAFVVPDSAITLIHVYLTTPAPEPEEEIGFLRRQGPYRLSTDHYGPVVLQLLRIPRVRDAVLKLIMLIHDANIEGTFGNYRPKDLVRSSVSPLENDADSIVKALTFLKHRGGFLLLEALKEVLAGTHGYTRSTGKSIQIGERPLADHPEVIRIREAALCILIEQLSSKDRVVFKGALDIADDIGHTRMGRVDLKDLPLHRRIASEYERVINLLKINLETTEDITISSSIVSFFENHWAQDKPSSEIADRALMSFARTPEFLFAHYYLGERVIEDFQKLRDATNEDSEGRWHHFVYNTGLKWDRPFTSYANIIPSLTAKYNTSEEIISFLIETEAHLHGKETRWKPPVVKAWAEHDRETFAKIRMDNTLWNSVPQRFQLEIDQALSTSEECLAQFLEDAHANIATLPPIECCLFLDIVTDRLPVEQVEKEVHFLIEHRGGEFSGAILHQLFRIYKRFNDFEVVLRLCHRILEKYPIDKPVINGLAFLLRVRDEENRLSPTHKQALRERIFPALVKLDELSHDGNEVLALLLDDAESMRDFLEQRLVEMSERVKNREFGYDCFPYHGLRSVNEFLTNFDQYKSFMDRFLEWDRKYHSFCRHDLTQLMKPVRVIRGPDNKLYLARCVESHLERGELEKALKLGEYLQLSEENIPLIVLLCQRAMEGGFEDGAKRLLGDFTLPEDGWSSEIGEAPPVLIELKSQFEKLREAASHPEVKKLADECASYVQKIIDDGLKRDRDRFD